MIKDTYQTINEKAEGQFKDKGSKFLAFAYPINNEDEVKTKLQELKKEHFSARHHCYAYRLGANGEHYRANDDGEPSGTAGRPILGQLLSNDLTNVLIVVVRYFGGTLLGVSGLINAYKSAASDVIYRSIFITHVVQNHFSLEFDYSIQNSIMRVIKEEEIDVINSKFEMKCQLIIGIRLLKEEMVLSKLSKIENLKIIQLNEDV